MGCCKQPDKSPQYKRFCYLVFVKWKAERSLVWKFCKNLAKVPSISPAYTWQKVPSIYLAKVPSISSSTTTTCALTRSPVQAGWAADSFQSLNKKMPESRPEDALGTLVKLQNCAKCIKYLTLLHCELSDLTDGTDWTNWTDWTDCHIWKSEKV